MRSALGASAAVALGLASAPAAADLTRAAKVACVVDAVTRCAEPGNCTRRAANAGEKAQVLEVDFAAKPVSMRRDGVPRHEGDVLEDTIKDGVRRVTVRMARGGRPLVLLAIAADGKLVITMAAGGGHKEEATCTAS